MVFNPFYLISRTLTRIPVPDTYAVECHYKVMHAAELDLSCRTYHCHESLIKKQVVSLFGGQAEFIVLGFTYALVNLELLYLA